MLQTWTSAATIRCSMHPKIDAIPLDGYGEIESKPSAHTTVHCDDLYHTCTFEVAAPITPHWKVLRS